MSNKPLLGILGGTFDPIHNAHLQTAHDVKNVLQLDQVLLVPAAVTVHRQQPVLSPQQRLELLRLAVTDKPEFLVETDEIDRGGKSFMIDTLQRLREKHLANLVLIMGQDAFAAIEGWHRWQELLDYCHLAIDQRPGYGVNYTNALLDQQGWSEVADVRQQESGCIVHVEVSQMDISSSNIRDLLRKRQSISQFVPAAVDKAIKENGYYL